MFLKAFVLLVAIGSALAFIPLKPKVNADRSLLDFMLQTRAVSSGNPALNQYCFNRYLPILKEIADQYELDYNNCVDTYLAECAVIDANFAKPREEVSNTTLEACEALQKCDGVQIYADAFDCFASAGSDQARKLFSMAANATEYASVIRELYRSAENVAQLCINNADATFWTNTDQTHDELQQCLAGNIIEPSSTATTPKPSTASSTVSSTASSTVSSTVSSTPTSTTSTTTRITSIIN